MKCPNCNTEIKKMNVTDFFIGSFWFPAILISLIGTYFNLDIIALPVVFFIGVFYIVYSFLYDYDKVDGKLSLYYWITNRSEVKN